MELIVGPHMELKSPNQYIVNVINEKKSVPIKISDHRIDRLLNVIEEWAGRDLHDLFVTGSSAKGTSLKGNSDLDLFISLKANTNQSLKDIFNSLFSELRKNGFDVEKRNVAQRIRHWNLQIDVVPGKKLPNQSHRHSLYTSRWPDSDRIQTNVHHHVNTVIGSDRLNEILALKIWKKINRLEFPSMYLEMYTIDALSGKWTGKSYLAKNFLYVLEHISKYFMSTAVYDPSNSRNTISNSLYKYEKEAIQQAAQRSLSKTYLKQIIY